MTMDDAKRLAEQTILRHLGAEGLAKADKLDIICAAQVIYKAWLSGKIDTDNVVNFPN